MSLSAEVVQSSCSNNALVSSDVFLQSDKSSKMSGGGFSTFVQILFQAKCHFWRIGKVPKFEERNLSVVNLLSCRMIRVEEVEIHAALIVIRFSKTTTRLEEKGLSRSPDSIDLGLGWPPQTSSAALSLSARFFEARKPDNIHI